MSHTNAQQLLDAALAELDKNNNESAGKLLQQFLELEPSNAPALDLAARIHLSQQRFDLAAEMAQRAVAVQSVAQFVVTLAEALKGQGHQQKALIYFRKVLEQVPQDKRSLKGLGEIYEQAGYRRAAIKFYKKFLDVEPDNLDVAIKYSSLLPAAEMNGGLATLERARPSTQAGPRILMSYFNHYVTYKEWAERVRYGQMPYHTAKIDELFFKFSADDRDAYETIATDLLSRKPNDKQALTAKACCVFSRGLRSESEHYFRQIAQHKPGTVYDSIAFSTLFHQNLEIMPDSKLTAQLPPLVEVVSASFKNEHVIYLSCNYKYFVDFARAMLLSINAVCAQAQVHLHIMDGSTADLFLVKSFCADLTNVTIAISSEQPGVSEQGSKAARCYYHAIRFIRLYHHLKQYNKTLWLMDVDALIHQDLQPMFASIGMNDVAFRARPGRWEPWNQFNASVLAISPTERGAQYLRLIAAYIADFYQRGELRWGIDQLAMYAVYEYLKDTEHAPQVYLLNDRAVDYDCFDDGFVWCNSGRGKFLQLRMLEKGVDVSIDPERAKYFDVLKKYTTQLNEPLS